MGDPFRIDRERMVEHQLKKRSIHDPRVLQAFRRVPRHEFVPENLRQQAYADGPLPIGEGQTISQPYMVAIMTQVAEITPGNRILEIGTGSGYQTAILLEMAAEVYTIERVPQLSEQALETLRRLNYTEVHTRAANGTLGWEEEAPFDAILVTAGAPQIPRPLLDQLAIGGRLVIPLDEDYSQVLYIVRRTEEGFEKKRGERCTFVPLIGEHGWKKDPRIH
ncbi:protein-L-isoaspartate(D-aspartate) O-methyltransferase [Acidobacteria bacterium AH-259-A15]|nr:protein-L-isoaspartate(D-aspartate) O-methyltransferase [Acidobacteria bacterium AH-259-A15]